MNKNADNGFPAVPERFHSAVESALSSLPERERGTARGSVSKPVKILLSAAAICALLSVTVFAAGKLGWLTRIGNYGVGVQPEQTAQSTAIQNKYVKLVWNYMPDYLVPTDDNEKFRTVTDGKEDPDGVSMLLYTTEAASRLELRNVVSTQPVTLGEHEGAILRYPDGGNGVRVMLVNFDKEGYTLLMYVSERISDEELVKIASGFGLVGTDDESEAFLPETFLNLAPVDGEEVSLPSDEELLENISVSVAENNRSAYAGAYSPVSESFPTFDLHVTGARVADTVDGLDRKGIVEYQRKNVDETGSILPDRRNYYSDGDGIDTLNEITGTQTVSRRLLLIDMAVQNTSGKDTEFYLAGAVAASEISRSVMSAPPLASDAFYISGADGDSGRFLFLPIGADETITFTVGYLIDADADAQKLVYSLEEFRENQPYAELHFDLGAFFG